MNSSNTLSLSLSSSSCSLSSITALHPVIIPPTTDVAAPMDAANIPGRAPIVSMPLMPAPSASVALTRPSSNTTSSNAPSLLSPLLPRL